LCSIRRASKARCSGSQRCARSGSRNMAAGRRDIRGIAAEEHVIRLRESLLPLAKQFHQMASEAIESLRRQRQMPAVEVERAAPREIRLVAAAEQDSASAHRADARCPARHAGRASGVRAGLTANRRDGWKGDDPLPGRNVPHRTFGWRRGPAGGGRSGFRALLKEAILYNSRS
jgi:hypothetical protein